MFKKTVNYKKKKIKKLEQKNKRKKIINTLDVLDKKQMV